MADNVTATDGPTFRTTDVAGVHVPHSKVAFGAAGAETPVEDSTGFRLPVKVGEEVAVNEVRVATASVTEPATSGANATLLSANSSRRGLYIANDAGIDLLVKLGAVASASSFSLRLKPGEIWVMPKPIYTGRVDGILASAGSGVARMTELSV